MRPVGYLINTGDGPAGEPGLFYNYILAGNGLFVEARSQVVTATLLVADADVRGLAPLAERVELIPGRIPRVLYELAISVLADGPREERYLAITWEGHYHLRAPPQEGSSGGVTYERLPNTVVDIHSHGSMGAFFTETDDRDEQGLRVYIVVGKLDTLWPRVKVRVGVYGYFAPISVEEVFV